MASSSLPAISSLQQLAGRFLLRHAPDYDDDSRQVIAEAFATLPDALCAAIATCETFAGCAVLPSVLDLVRQSFTSRPKAARHLFTTLLDGPLQGVEICEGVVASCDRLLTVGIFKRDVIGPSFARPEADMLRRLRKAAQRGAEAAGGTDRWRQAVWSARLGNEHQESWQRRYQLQRLDAYTG